MFSFQSPAVIQMLEHPKKWTTQRKHCASLVPYIDFDPFPAHHVPESLFKSNVFALCQVDGTRIFIIALTSS